MDKRTFVSKQNGWPGEILEYSAVGSAGTYYGTCSIDEWNVYRIKEQLIDAGADEKLVNELYSLAHSIGSDDEAMLLAGESL